MRYHAGSWGIGMSMKRRVATVAIIVASALTVIAVFIPQACARDKFIGDLVLNLVDPASLRPQSDDELGNVGEILAIPLYRPGAKRRDLPQFLADWLFLADRGSRSLARGEAFDDPRVSDWFFPGRSLRSLHGRWTKLASLKPMICTFGDEAGKLVDAADRTLTAGSLVGESTRVYSRLEIRVDRSAYRLDLVGFRGGNEKLLYTTRVGLGSPEFPTPRGSFYVCRIFDDKPLWIPPPDRWWAWGQSPSRSVYGGHMMPFFKKVKSKSKGLEDDPVDLVEPQVKMVDAGAYRIHGTNSPWSVGSGQSHGCVRMLNSTVKILADNLKMYAGTTTRGETANGPFVNLARPVKLILY